MEQINNILKQLEKFKEEGSTTKWFSEEYIFNKTVTIKISNKDVK